MLKMFFFFSLQLLITKSLALHTYETKLLTAVSTFAFGLRPSKPGERSYQDALNLQVRIFSVSPTVNMVTALCGAL